LGRIPFLFSPLKKRAILRIFLSSTLQRKEKSKEIKESKVYNKKMPEE